MVLLETGTDIIIDGFRVALRDLAKEYRDVEAAVVRGRFHAHHNALAMDGLRTFLVLTRRKKDLDFELGHQFDAFIDLAIRARTADIQRLGNDISIFLRDPDRDMGQRPLAFSSLVSCVLRWDHFSLPLLRLQTLRPRAFFETVFVAIVRAVTVIPPGLFHGLFAFGTIFTDL